MGLNGMVVLLAARHRFANVPITETHPKVLYWCLFGKKYDYQTSSAEMDSALGGALGISVESRTEHEWDAAVSALVALKGIMGQWPHDLHALPVSKGERLITPCGPTHYFWPE